MTIKKLAAAATLLCAAALPGIAQAATATSTVNVRSGPGTNYAVVDTLRAGEQVDVDRCTSGWCFVEKTGPDGWVSSRYLSDDDGISSGGGISIGGGGNNSDVDVSIGFSVPGFNFQIGNGGFNFIPGRPVGRDAEVCFYERANFRGASFCADPGDRLARLGSWNDRISSIEVSGSAQALVCQDTNFNGRCVVISRDVRNLRGADDRISSIRVR
jgi:uncharacterized protein YraI